MLKELRFPLGMIVVVVIASILYLALNPAVDVQFSALFFGKKHFLGHSSNIAKFYDAAVYAVSFGIFALTMLCAGRLIFKERKFGDGARRLLFFALVLIIGSVGTVQALKFTMERPRPYSIVQFAGTEQFVPVLKFNQLGKENVPPSNRSFPSGHTACAFAVIALAAVAHRRRVRLAIFCAGFTFAGVTGLMRILEGNHYLSDVLGSMGIVGAVMILLDWLWPMVAAKIDRTFFARKY